jgi:hypothetical protein
MMATANATVTIHVAGLPAVLKLLTEARQVVKQVRDRPGRTPDVAKLEKILTEVGPRKARG